MKKILKKEINIKRENTNFFKSVLSIKEISLNGKNPPEEIKVIAKFNELNVLNPNISKIMNINKVNEK